MEMGRDALLDYVRPFVDSHIPISLHGFTIMNGNPDFIIIVNNFNFQRNRWDITLTKFGFSKGTNMGLLLDEILDMGGIVEKTHMELISHHTLIHSHGRWGYNGSYEDAVLFSLQTGAKLV